MAALLIGTVVVLNPKGTRLHRFLGYLYSASVVTLVVTALSIYRLTRSFNILHVLTIITALSLTAGLWYAIVRRPAKNWLLYHYKGMCGSYVSLWAAFFSEILIRVVMPLLYHTLGHRAHIWLWPLLGMITLLVTGAGIVLIRRNRGRLLDLHGAKSA